MQWSLGIHFSHALNLQLLDRPWAHYFIPYPTFGVWLLPCTGRSSATFMRQMLRTHALTHFATKRHRNLSFVIIEPIFCHIGDVDVLFI